MNAKDAKNKLKLEGGNCYLIRYSEVRKIYLLSVMKKSPTPFHFQLKVKKEGLYEIDGSEQKFDSISGMLKHYENHPVNPLVERLGDMCINSKVAKMKEFVLQELEKKNSLNHSSSQPDTKLQTSLPTAIAFHDDMLVEKKVKREVSVTRRQSLEDVCKLLRYLVFTMNA